MASESEPYSAQVPPDLAERVDEQREREHPQAGEALTKTEAVTRALDTWVEKPTWRDQAHTAAVNLAMLAVVAFVTGETTEVLSISEAGMLAWTLIAVAAGFVALTEMVGVAREFGLDKRIKGLIRRDER